MEVSFNRRKRRRRERKEGKERRCSDEGDMLEERIALGFF